MYVDNCYMASTSSLSFDSVVRGYHVYKDIWEASEDELLPCRRETANRYDPFAVAVTKNDTIVGHVPRRISAICSMFLRRNGTIMCRVTGNRQYSRDLPQGGLEIPCILIFTGNSEHLSKARKLLDACDLKETEECIKIAECEVAGAEAKKRRVDDEQVESPVWVRVSGLVLYKYDHDRLSGGLELTDMHINASQRLLKSQFPKFQGLSSTLSPTHIHNWTDNYIQVLHCRSNHWITISTVGCNHDEINIYDSLYANVDNATKDIIEKIFASSTITISLPPVQRQIGVKDCGLFAVAFATYLAFGNDYRLLSSTQFKQHNLRSHMIACLENGSMTQFL